MNKLLKTTDATKSGVPVGSSAWLGGTVRLSMDCSRMNADVKEAAALAQSFERLLKRLRRIFDKLVCDGLGKRGVCVTPPTLRAGEFICVAGIRSRDFKLAASALRALQLDVAHKILDGVVPPNDQALRRREPGSPKDTNL